jgi:hypothetical protein
MNFVVPLEPLMVGRLCGTYISGVYFCAFLIPRGADKSLAFRISYFPLCSITKIIFLDGLKKLEQRSHKCVELRGNI